MNPKRSLLRNIVFGYDEIEPCVITALALKSNIFFTGAHGIGKTTIGKTLGQAVDSSGRGFRFFAADKANLITIGGLPDMERSSKCGKLQFMTTDTSIFGGKVILVDELPRADKERQNYWLEIVEARTFNGLPIDYEMLIATGNDATYRGSFDMDLALKSRFMFWLPSPSFNTVRSDEVSEMIGLNTIGGRPSVEELGLKINDALNEIRDKIAGYAQDRDLNDQISTWIGTFIQFVTDKVHADSELSKNNDAFISPREFAVHMPQAMIGLKAYFDYMNMPESLKLAGKYAMDYVIKSRHAAAGDKFTTICTMAWRQLSGMLVGEVNTPEGKLRYKFASSIGPAQKVQFWRDHLSDAIDHLTDSDITTMAGDTKQQIQAESIGLIGPFWNIMKAEAKTRHVANELEGFMITEVTRKLLDGKYFPQNPNGKLWTKYAANTNLLPESVSEILDHV